jgi:hypothetical protein
MLPSLLVTCKVKVMSFLEKKKNNNNNNKLPLAVPLYTIDGRDNWPLE